ncbi:MAG: ATP-binding protein [Bacteroidales bacterium]|nr:ATP-binding protein [Bacteroidales bacterium]
MTPNNKPRLPIGYQDFKSLRDDNCLYIDKTDLLYQLVHENGKCFFLSRPRRFGKSLLLSTLKYYWQGDKDLFKGLKIDSIEKQWNQHAVIHIDMNKVMATDPHTFDSSLRKVLKQEGANLGVNIDKDDPTIGGMLQDLIIGAAQKMGRGVVLLFDEYDKGLLETIRDSDRLEANTNILRNLFVQLKACDKYIRFAFITGVARFSHLTLFSGVNNLVDISMVSEYATLCGITMDELKANFQYGIHKVMDNNQWDYEEALSQLKQKYDGYRFTKVDKLVFNPFSVLNVMNRGEMDDFWVRSGTSKVLVDYLRNNSFAIEELSGTRADETQLASIYKDGNPIALLYQTGYLTVSGEEYGYYTLDIPNGEVRNALVNELIPLYMDVPERGVNDTVRSLRIAFRKNDIEVVMRSVQALIAKIPYEIMHRNPLEETFHMLVYEIFLMIGIDTESERSVSGGRIDMVASTPWNVYLFEFKLGGTPEEALAQIDSRDYALSWSADSRPVHRIGAVFSLETRALSSWRIIS